MTERNVTPFSKQERSAIITAISRGESDDAKRILASLSTNNCQSSLLWDCINTNLEKEFALMGEDNILIYNVKRGAWKMYFLYSPEHNFICTLMREERFETVKKEIRSGKQLHYLNVLLQVVNEDLDCFCEQISLFDAAIDQNVIKNECKKLLQQIIEDGYSPDRHSMVLFSSHDFQLTSIRVVCVNKNLEIYSEENWTQYIKLDESVYVEKATEEDTGVAQPSKGLKLSKKSHERKKKQSQVKVAEKECQETG